MKDLNLNLLRHSQREQLQHDVTQATDMLVHAKPDEKGTILAARNRTQKQLDAHSPEPLTGKEKDTLYTLEKKLKDRIATNMPTDEVMRKNSPGAVDWHLRWEKANKKLIRMWKNVRIQLNPDNSDRDLANIERFRPAGQMDRMRTDAQIPGMMTFSNIPDEMWPFDAPQNTALAQAKRAYSDDAAKNEVEAAIGAFDKDFDEEHTKEAEPVKRELTVEEHTVLVNRLALAREAKAKKRAEELQLNEALDSIPVSQLD